MNTHKIHKRARCRALKLFLVCGAFCALALTACGGAETPPPANPTGLSGKATPEAEILFAKAHVLWRGTETCSDPAKAVEYLNEALRIEPDFAEARLWRGLALSQLQRWDDALDDLTAAVRQNPTAQAYAWRGLGFFRTGNYLGARRDLDRSISLNASQHRAWNFRGALNLAEGKTEAACDDFSKGCGNGDCTGLENAREAKLCE